MIRDVAARVPHLMRLGKTFRRPSVSAGLSVPPRTNLPAAGRPLLTKGGGTTIGAQGERRAFCSGRNRAKRESPGAALGEGETERLPAHPPEPGYPCYVSVLGELAWMAPRGEPDSMVPDARVPNGPEVTGMIS